jgi:hypothetical protein
MAKEEAALLSARRPQVQVIMSALIRGIETICFLETRALI